MTGATDAWSFVPGPWLALLGRRTAVVVPAALRDRLGDLWPLVDDGATFAELLDALITPGLSALPDFVLTELCDDAQVTHAVVRGKQLSARLETADGPVEIDGSHVNTWAEHSGTGVYAIHISYDEDSDQDSDSATAPRVFVLPAGVVHVGHLSFETTAKREESSAEDAASAEAVVVAEPGEATELFDPMALNTEAGQVQPAEKALPEEPAPEVAKPVALLKVSNGETIQVDHPVLFGRAPGVKRFSGSEQPRLVTVPSPLHEISATHVEVRPGTGVDLGSAVVTDMGSTNGTVLIQPGLDHEELEPGVAVQLLPGAVINLGDGVTITVSRPGT